MPAAAAKMGCIYCWGRGTHEYLRYQGERGLFLNDTQMTLAVARALLDADLDSLDDPPEAAFDVVGPGWVGEEAVAGACYAHLNDPRRFENAVLIGANAAESASSLGKCDSDSVACSISGAAPGLEAIPAHWVEGIENRELLLATADELFAKARQRETV